MENSHPLVERSLSSALSVVARVRRRVEQFVRQYPRADAGVILAKLRAELGHAEPILAASLRDGIVAAWVAAARGPARDAAPVRDDFVEAPHLEPLEPESSTSPRRPVRYPVLEASVRDLLARQVVTADEYRELSDDAKDAAFTVARVVSANAVGAVRDALADDLANGGGLRGFARTVGPLLKENGLSDAQIETVYRTQTAQARAAGMQAVLANPVVGDEFPYVAYNAIHDNRTRPDHAALEHCGIQGTNVYRIDDPVIRRYWAPWSWNCRCAMIPTTLEDASELGIFEAREWLRSGRPPERPAWVPDPGFPLPKGWPDRSRVAPVVS